MENEPEVTVPQSIANNSRQIYKSFGFLAGLIAHIHGGETWKPRLSQKQVTVPQSYGFKAYLKRSGNPVRGA